MNNKGQALVEFVLILPVFILILFVIVDFGMIVNEKNSLENKSVDITRKTKSNKNINEIKKIYNDVNVELIENDDILKVVISNEVDIITPGLNRIFGDPYVVKVERFVYND